MQQPPSGEPPASQPPEPKQLQLVVHAGPLAGKGFPITGRALTFGRDPDNDITLDDSEVSRHHARLFRQNDQIIIEDLGSTNGTLINGKRITGPHILQPADIISIGSSVFGVRGFAAPHTVSVTQVSSEKPPFAPYPPAPPPPERPVPPKPAPSAGPRVPPKRTSGLSALAIGGLLAAVIIILIGAAITAYFIARTPGPETAGAPTVVITAPLPGSEFKVNSPVTVQATASDPAGVVRMELWVSGVKTAESVSPLAQGQPTLTASFKWTPDVPGTYTLEIKAFNEPGNTGNPGLVTINVVAGEPPTPTPTDTPTPQPPTATVPATPSLVAQTDLNVRAGPGTNYNVIGLLPVGAPADVVGRSEDGQWWQIRFDLAENGLGWVSADPAFATTANVDNVQVAPAPPTATPTPTNTPAPTDTPVPTDTPTPTSIPPTNTPTPTATPTGEPVVIQFEVSPPTIEGGECVNITWNVSGVKAIYYGAEGVTGTDSRQDCPKDSQTYTLRIVLKDDTEQIEERAVEVVNPIVSAGTLVVDPNQTVDFDDGAVPGDDFVWNVNNGIRQFEAQAGVQLAPMEDVSNLKNLTLAECAAASFGAYTFIDGSDVVLDPVNQLIPGRAACYRTTAGRLGKMRFPEASTGSLTVEWLTWK